MAVMKIWPIKGKVDSPLNYVSNEMKTANPRWDKSSFENLTDVMHYAADYDKTEKQFFVTGINCNADTARDQFVTVKKQFGKEDGIIAYHGYQSFAKGEVTPKLAHQIGIEFAKKVWGKNYQVVVATHLNTEHIHNHFVVNSISYTNGKRCREKQWYDLNKINDEICKSHKLSVITEPKRKRLPYKLYEQEQARTSRKAIAKKAIDEAISVSSNMKEFELALKSMRYTCNFDPKRKYWTIKLDTWKKVMRLEGLGEDYSNERIKERILISRDEKTFVTFQKFIVVRRQYTLPTRLGKIKRRGGIKGLYLHYCYLLGYLPKYTQKQTRVSQLLRDDLTKLDKISEEVKFLYRENISTTEELLYFKEKKEESIVTKGSQRGELKKALRRKGSNEEKAKIKDDISVLTRELAILRKEVKMAQSIETRAPAMKDKVNQIEKQDIKTKDYKDIALC